MPRATWLIASCGPLVFARISTARCSVGGTSMLLQHYTLWASARGRPRHCGINVLLSLIETWGRRHIATRCRRPPAADGAYLTNVIQRAQRGDHIPSTSDRNIRWTTTTAGVTAHAFRWTS